MKELDFLKSINDIDNDLIQAANQMPAKKKFSPVMVSVIALAASVCIIVGLNIFTMRSFKPRTVSTDTIVSFALGDTYYEIADLNTYMNYGLVDKASISRSTVSISPITSKDLGEYMGTITLDSKKEYNVYHYLPYPDSNQVCIVEISKNEYQLYVVRE